MQPNNSNNNNCHLFNDRSNSKGWKLVKTHDLKFLLDEVGTYNKHLEPFYDLVIRLKGYYLEERYPVVGMNVTIEEVKEDFNEVKKLIKIIKDDVG